VIAAAAPAMRLAWRAAVALACCFAVEFSQTGSSTSARRAASDDGGTPGARKRLRPP
jgi:hypothetical protein